MYDEDIDALNTHNGYYSKFIQFQELVEHNFKTEKSANTYAGWMNMTTKHLNRINKLTVNKTTSELISDRIILEAKRLLIYAHNNFSEIAEQLGFDDYAHFSKLFKHKTGMNPSDFTKKYL
jgi:AraC-like DNA-binding protein